MNPVLEASEGEGVNNSDVDLFEYQGKTYVYYATGDQQTWGAVKVAMFNGDQRTFFESHFPGDLPVVTVSARHDVSPPDLTASTKNYHTDETPFEKHKRLEWFREARFGMFIHWGLYAVPAGEHRGITSGGISSYIQDWANIPRDEYAEFAKGFNPVDFDASAWAQLAQDAGQKYLVITAKHHEGFCTYDSAFTDFDVVDATPYGRDIMAELSRECKKRGIHFGVYYSIPDWHDESQFTEIEGKHRTSGTFKNKILPDKKPAYVQYMKDQLRELVEKYDPEIIWFDGEWVDWWSSDEGKDLYNYVRNLKPEILVNNRADKERQVPPTNDDRAYAGDFGTPEQEIPATGIPGKDWETCMTMNNTWGYKHYDDQWKSTQVLLRNLIDIVSKGGNYLLNVGPMSNGRIPEASITRLREMGAWLKANGEAIYGTSASPFAVPWGRITQKENKLYLHIFDWPSNPENVLELPALDNVAEKASVLGHQEAHVVVVQSPSLLHLDLPERSMDPIATVVVLELDGPARVRKE
jgi:alpha-L-fucosidase